MQDAQDRDHGPGVTGGTEPADAADAAEQMDPAGPIDPSDPLLAIRTELDRVDELPLDGRAEVFERTHRIVVDELRALELG